MAGSFSRKKRLAGRESIPWLLKPQDRTGRRRIRLIALGRVISGHGQLRETMEGWQEKRDHDQGSLKLYPGGSSSSKTCGC